MTQTLALKQAGPIVLDLVDTINANRAYLSEIDGLIGDGDHGINMSKGFTICGDALRAKPELPGLAEGLDALAMTLLEGIGGSMGPLYGSFFMGLAETLAGKETLDAQLFGEALAAGVEGVETVGSAKVGDKTLIDTMVPALNAFTEAVGAGSSFADALKAMSVAAEAGKNSTKDLQARIGRSARLGARSIGVLDAGATSCFLILQSISNSLQRHLAK